MERSSYEFGSLLLELAIVSQYGFQKYLGSECAALVVSATSIEKEMTRLTNPRPCYTQRDDERHPHCWG